MSFRVYENITIQPGEELTLNIAGEFVTVTEASSGFRLGFDADSTFPVLQGFKFRTAAPFQVVRLGMDAGAASAATVSLAIGYGDLHDSRALFSGGIKTRGGGSGFSDATVSVGTAPVQILSEDANRSSAIIRAGSADLYLGPDNTVTASGVATIPAGSSMIIAHTGAVFGIRASSTDDAGLYVEAV